MFDNRNQNVLNATSICTGTSRTSILCGHRISCCISRRNIDLCRLVFPVQQMRATLLRHCRRQRCYRMVAPATGCRGICLRAICRCRNPSTWRNRSFGPRTVDWWNPLVACPWTSAPMCRTWPGTILECRAVAMPRSNPSQNCALNRSFPPTFCWMFASSRRDAAIGTGYFCWDRCHRIPNCTGRCGTLASCTGLAANCLNSRSSPGWRDQRNRMTIASKTLKRKPKNKLIRFNGWSGWCGGGCLHGYRLIVSLWLVDVASSLNSGNGIGELFASTGLAEAPRANSSSSSGFVTVESASLVFTRAERRCVKLFDDGGTNFNVVRFDDVKSMPTSDNVFCSCSVITIWNWKREMNIDNFVGGCQEGGHGHLGHTYLFAILCRLHHDFKIIYV